MKLKVVKFQIRPDPHKQFDLSLDKQRNINE